jgi:circadian clock protein KaiC
MPTKPQAGTIPPRISTGVAGLDDILNGGLTAQRLYLIEGSPGAGKTTLGLQFLLDGVAKGEAGLYITLSETADELVAVAHSHGWSLDAIAIHELASDTALDPDAQQSVFHPSELELGETTQDVMKQVDLHKPVRVVFDSLSEMRLLAQSPLRYRRQILALKQFFASRACTVLLLDDKTGDADQHLHSLAHGVVSLEQIAKEFGTERRRVSIVKMRGIQFRGGYHDYLLQKGGMRVFPRLVAAEHVRDFSAEVASSGLPDFDVLLGGGLVAGTNTLMLGPSGVGKSTLSVRCMLSALERGERAAYYLFDEGLGTFVARNAGFGMDLRPHIDSGALAVHHIDPAELSPGEFAQMLRDAVEQRGVKFLVIDSMNAYLQAMPGALPDPADARTAVLPEPAGRDHGAGAGPARHRRRSTFRRRPELPERHHRAAALLRVERARAPRAQRHQEPHHGACADHPRDACCSATASTSAMPCPASRAC